MRKIRRGGTVNDRYIRFERGNTQGGKKEPLKKENSEKKMAPISYRLLIECCWIRMQDPGEYQDSYGLNFFIFYMVLDFSMVILSNPILRSDNSYF